MRRPPGKLPMIAVLVTYGDAHDHVVGQNAGPIKCGLLGPANKIPRPISVPSVLLVLQSHVRATILVMLTDISHCAFFE
jgi:hypothetical protein